MIVMAVVNETAGGQESVKVKISLKVCRKTYNAHLYTSAWYWKLKLVSPLTLLTLMLAASCCQQHYVNLSEGITFHEGEKWH